MTIEINMKWVVRFVLVMYMCYRAVYGAKIEPGLSVEQIQYDDEGYMAVGTRKSVNCKAFHKSQKLEWRDPFGNVIKRVHSNRVFAQEHSVTSPKGGRAPGLVLTFTELMVTDSGVYQCESGDLKKNVSICVIKPSTFVDTPTEVITEVGRSITLTCQAKGEPEPRIIWNRNQEELTEETSGSKYKVNTKYNSEGFESLLTITSLAPEDNGLYTCVSVQESPMLDDCVYEASLNISLQVNSPPIFENDNETEKVFGKTNQVVDLVCSANGFPLPSYRWFKEVGSDTLFEFEQKQIIYSEEDNQAILSVTAGPTTFGQKYKCKATNTFGESDKSFSLHKIEKPKKASEVKVTKSDDSKIYYNIIWNDDSLFPIYSFDIQYKKSSEEETESGKPKEPEWWKSTQIIRKYDDYVISSDWKESTFVLNNLNEDTEYWFRLRGINGAGAAPWSDPVVGKTNTSESVDEEEDEGTEDEIEGKAIVSTGTGSDGGTFYGIFFAGGIIIVAVACMFAMRLV